MWTVIEARGRGTWIAEINADELDYAGSQAAFTTQQIQAAIGWENSCNKSMDESANFYANLKPGSIVHYSNGFDQYVRCQVMPDHTLRPIALVGAWRPYDLPHRSPDGSIYNGYHVDQIISGKTMTPHASNVWEFPKAPCRNGIDPRGLAAIDYSLPPMTDEQKETAELWQTVNRIRQVTHVDGTANPLEVLTAVKGIVDTWKNGAGQLF
jgi:hypothetical protein